MKIQSSMVALSLAPGPSSVLAWPALPGQTYQVEHSSDLTQWFVLNNLTVGRGTVTVTDSTPRSSLARRFYRLR